MRLKSWIVTILIDMDDSGNTQVSIEGMMSDGKEWIMNGLEIGSVDHNSVPRIQFAVLKEKNV